MPQIKISITINVDRMYAQEHKNFLTDFNVHISF